MTDYVFYGNDYLISTNVSSGGNIVALTMSGIADSGWLFQSYPFEAGVGGYYNTLYVTNTRNERQQFMDSTGGLLIRAQGFEVVAID